MPLETKLFQDRVKTARFLRGFSQTALAEKVECCPDTVSRWELGRNFPFPEQLLRLATTLKVNVLWLAMGEGPMEIEAVPSLVTEG